MLRKRETLQIFQHGFLKSTNVNLDELVELDVQRSVQRWMRYPLQLLHGAVELEPFQNLLRHLHLPEWNDLPCGTQRVQSHQDRLQRPRP